MSALQSLENSLNDVFVKKAPALPANGKKALVEYLPWINLLFGVLAIYTAYVLWHWAHLVNGLVNFANSLSAAYGGTPVVANRLTVTVWLSMGVMAAQGLIYLAAFSGLRARKKSGWNLLFYGLLLNVVYGVVVLFSSYGSAGNLVAAVVESAIGFYLLFQVRSSYGKAPAAAPKA
jgi:hypothetical protein